MEDNALDVNNIALMIRYPNQKTCFKFDQGKRMMDLVPDPKVWDMLDVISPRHRYKVKNQDSKDVEFLFSEYWVANNPGLRKIERVVKMSEKKDIPVKFKDIAKLMELTIRTEDSDAGR